MQLSKVVSRQDADFKLSPSTSNETSINLSNDIADLLSYESETLTFKLYKSDLIKALSAVCLLQPLYYKKESECSPARLLITYKYLVEQLDKQFGDNETSFYTIDLLRREDGRNYLNKLKLASGFNLRSFLIEKHSQLVFNKTDNGELAIRLISSLSVLDSPIEDESFIEEEPPRPPLNEPLQLIFYGAPGTGKSYTIDKMAKDDVTVRTTFHPDSDYASFVGAYKPTMQAVKMSAFVGTDVYEAVPKGNHSGMEKKIVYKYVPQAFLKAYVAAWSDLDNPHYLVIEEINRGNCAQIFGDLFQLLDRNNMGSSSYAIHADEDIAQFLATDANGFANLSDDEKEAIRSFVLVKDSGERLHIGDDLLSGKKLLLPPNLYIWATMNTSDQSLFPIDSAFKRRWNWRYMPIDYTKKNHTFLVGGKRYSWGDFLRKMNPEISRLTESPDKQMGYFFAKADLKSREDAPENDTISEEIFLNKVLFYLWTDVIKDFEATGPFVNPDTNRAYEFSDFFDPERNCLQKFVEKLELEEVEVAEDAKPDSGSSRTDYTTLTVTFPDNTVISEPTINDTYIKAIEKIGLDRAAEAAATKKYQRRGHELISRVKYSDLEDEGYKYAQVGDYYVVLPTRSESLRGMLELMSEMFDLGLNISLE